MPKYEYDCERCGPFSDFRSLAEYQLPAECPNCGAASPRVELCFPAMSTRGATAPRNASGFSATSGHSAGCRCCGNFKIPRKEWTSKLL